MAITLSREDVQKLRGLDRDIKDVMSDIVKAERAGIDVADLKSKLEAAEQLRKGLLREFGARTPAG